MIASFIKNIRNNNQSQPRPVTPVVICALLSAIGFNLWHLFPEIIGGGIAPNDTLFHWRLIDTAVDAMTHGRDFTDPWQGTMSLGFPVFHHYQHLSHIPLALIHVLTLKAFPVIDLIRWATYLLVSLFPLSIYWSLRRFRFDPLTCAMGGLLASLIGNDFQLWGGFGYDNYTFGGFGLYTQLWGMVLLPVALAVGYETIRTGRGYFWATLLLSATLMSHLIFGYMAFLSLGFLTLLPNSQVFFDKSHLLAIWNHWRRLLVLFVLVLSVTLYFVVPFMLDREHFGLAVENTDQLVSGSLGHQAILEALVKGNLFDLGRFPSFSILVFAGIVSCIFYRRTNHYLVPIAFFLLWLLLFFGRSTWGPVMDLLPLSQNIHLHRFVAGVHLGGIFVAAIALAVPWRWAMSRGNVMYIAGALALTILVLSPIYIERRAYLSDNASEKQENERALDAEREEIDDLIEALKELPLGRVFAGLTAESGERWGEEYHIGGTPVALILGVAGLDVFSATLHRYSLVSTSLSAFDEGRPDQYNLFNIRYVVAPEEVAIPEFMKPVKTFGRHHLYQVDTTGYFDLVGSSLLFAGDKAAYFQATKAWLTSALPAVKRHPQVSISGSPKHQEQGARPNTVISSGQIPADLSLSSLDELNSSIAQSSAEPPRGSIVSEDIGTNYYSATVDVERESMLMLKATFHPNWRITVDGSEEDSLMLMPGFTGVQLAPGEHVIVMEYRSRSLRKFLLGWGLLTLVSIVVWEKKSTNISARIKSWTSGSVTGATNRSRGNRAGKRRQTRRNR